MKFKTSVCEVYALHRCEEYKAQEDRGVYGCHPRNCSLCKREFVGWELWGENGHKQGHLTSIGGWPVPTRKKFIEWIAHLAKMELGKRYPMQFRKGRSITFYAS